MADDEKIVIEIRTQGGDVDEFLIKRNMLMGKVMEKYCKLKNLEKRSMRFLLDGTPLTDVDTAISVSPPIGCSRILLTIQSSRWKRAALLMFFRSKLAVRG
jgi:hypothetical protein